MSGARNDGTGEANGEKKKEKYSLKNQMKQLVEVVSGVVDRVKDLAEEMRWLKDSRTLGGGNKRALSRDSESGSDNGDDESETERYVPTTVTCADGNEFPRVGKSTEDDLHIWLKLRRMLNSELIENFTTRKGTKMDPAGAAIQAAAAAMCLELTRGQGVFAAATAGVQYDGANSMAARMGLDPIRVAHAAKSLGGAPVFTDSKAFARVFGKGDETGPPVTLQDFLGGPKVQTRDWTAENSFKALTNLGLALMAFGKPCKNFLAKWTVQCAKINIGSTYAMVYPARYIKELLEQAIGGVLRTLELKNPLGRKPETKASKMLLEALEMMSPNTLGMSEHIARNPARTSRAREDVLGKEEPEETPRPGKQSRRGENSDQKKKNKKVKFEDKHCLRSVVEALWPEKFAGIKCGYGEDCALIHDADAFKMDKGAIQDAKKHLTGATRGPFAKTEVKDKLMKKLAKLEESA